jgi:hypothetical protein
MLGIRPETVGSGKYSDNFCNQMNTKIIRGKGFAWVRSL